MNLTDLSKLDVKDLGKIDYVKILKGLQKRYDLMAVIAMGLGTLIFCVQFYSHHATELSNLSREVYTLEQKIKSLDAYASTQKELNDFVKGLPQNVSEEELVNKITDLAVKRNIEILSFSPARKQKDKLNEITTVTLSISAKDFKDMWLFIHDIERMNSAIRIDSWQGSMGAKNSTTRQPARGAVSPNATAQTSEWINAQVQISGIKFNNDQP